MRLPTFASSTASSPPSPPIRRGRLAFLAFLAASGLVLTAASCASSSTEANRFPVSDLPEAGKTRPDSSFDAGPPDDSSAPDASSGPGRVYAHTTDTLYLYEPVSGDLKTIGKFSCLDAANSLDVVVDIAVDRTGSMFATTFRRFLTVDPTTAVCTELAKAIGADFYPNALSFVPTGTVDPTKEVLVGYAALGVHVDSIDYVQIDTTTGVMTKIGDMNATDAGAQYKSSGDLIALIQDGNRAYATVKLTSGAAGNDLLAEITPSTGHIKRIIGDTKQTNLYGFGYWAGKGYGFSDKGQIIAIDMTTGAGTVVKTLTATGGAAVPWYGAGVTTQAPTR